jgi:hypothetical protein
MDRRNFLAAVASFMAAAMARAALPAPIRPALAEPVVAVRYGHSVTYTGWNEEMHWGVKKVLDDMAAETVATVGVPMIGEPEYLWISRGVLDKSDPLCQYAVGAIKFDLAIPKSKFDADTRRSIEEGGWVSVGNYSTLPEKPLEFADFQMDGKAVRHARTA